MPVLNLFPMAGQLGGEHCGDSPIRLHQLRRSVVNGLGTGQAAATKGRQTRHGNWVSGAARTVEAARDTVQAAREFVTKKLGDGNQTP